MLDLFNGESACAVGLSRDRCAQERLMEQRRNGETLARILEFH